MPIDLSSTNHGGASVTGSEHNHCETYKVDHTDNHIDVGGSMTHCGEFGGSHTGTNSFELHGTIHFG